MQKITIAFAYENKYKLFILMEESYIIRGKKAE